MKTIVVFCKHEFSGHGLETDWVQMNNTLSRDIGTLRGMHFQYPPKAEAKIIRCLRGAVWDVIVDLREGSPTLGKWFGVEINDINRTMVYVPKGFAHGFQTLQANSELLYWHSEYYDAEEEGGLHYDDPDVGIDWPMSVSQLSVRDSKHPQLKELPLISI